jgi:hypothetical protein
LDLELDLEKEFEDENIDMVLVFHEIDGVVLMKMKERGVSGVGKGVCCRSLF